MNILRLVSLSLSFILPPSAFAAPHVSPAIIFDTDYRSDCDDVGSLAMLHALRDRGQVTLLGVIATTTGRHVVGAIDAVNTYYGRPDLPIGVVAPEKGLNTTVNYDDFARTCSACLVDRTGFNPSQEDDPDRGSSPAFSRLRQHHRKSRFHRPVAPTVCASCR